MNQDEWAFNLSLTSQPSQLLNEKIASLSNLVQGHPDLEGLSRHLTSSVFNPDEYYVRLEKCLGEERGGANGAFVFVIADRNGTPAKFFEFWKSRPLPPELRPNAWSISSEDELCYEFTARSREQVSEAKELSTKAVEVAIKAYRVEVDKAHNQLRSEALKLLKGRSGSEESQSELGKMFDDLGIERRKQ
jgi:hypothetical protein